MLPYLAIWTSHRLRRQHTTEIRCYVAVSEDEGRGHKPRNVGSAVPGGKGKDKDFP